MGNKWFIEHELDNLDRKAEKGEDDDKLYDELMADLVDAGGYHPTAAN